jgi:hypothetical protein
MDDFLSKPKTSAHILKHPASFFELATEKNTVEADLHTKSNATKRVVFIL